MEFIAEGNSKTKASKLFKVARTTINEWEEILEETGSLEKRKLERSFKKIDPVKLQAYVKEHPDAFLREIAEAFDCNESAIRKAFRRLKITRKKNETIRRARRSKKS